MRTRIHALAVELIGSDGEPAVYDLLAVLSASSHGWPAMLGMFAQGSLWEVCTPVDSLGQRHMILKPYGCI